ncbi:chain length determinant protein [Actinacidiphila sp. ITFR-21]|uniref:chain length determinant protein n=1 Tax=Actinacidiphila sp. ITFR-21 TaxID=3075199 RepID=UPI0028897836|nr:chain length determinant protein [Streptomyces sp. ITFR-21]WNI14420.1 chain length determinant protein [Streptomyces sp. ITFR-21]
MDLAEICRVMGRRWYILVPGLLLTVVVTVGVYLAVPISYQSQSTVMLLNSQAATKDFDGNPFLSTQTSLTGMADSLARNLNSDASLAALRRQGASGTLVAKIADNAQGPLMWLTVTGTRKTAVLKSDTLLTAYAKQRLADFQVQQGVVPQAMIRMTTIVPPQIPVAQTKTRLEYLVMAALAGLVISMVATFYVEARLRRPAGRRHAGRAAGPETRPPEQPAVQDPPAPVRAARPAPRWAGEGDRAPVDRTPVDRARPADPADPADPAPPGPLPEPADESVTTGGDAHRFV